MSDAIGALRARVQLERPVRVADEIGGAALAWLAAGTVWAEIAAEGGGAGTAFDTAPSTALYRLTLRRRDGVRAGWRVLWGARVLRILAVLDEGRARIALRCEEETL